MRTPPTTQTQRPFIQRGVTLKVGADKVQRGARQWQTNAGEWYARSGKVPDAVYNFIDAAAKDLAAATRDWANFLKGKGRNRVTDKLIFDATRRVENVMFLSHALENLSHNPNFIDANGRRFIYEYIAAKTAGVTPFLLPPELIPAAKKVGLVIFAEASGAPKQPAVLKANADGVAQWLRAPEKPFTKTPGTQYIAVPVFQRSG